MKRKNFDGYMNVLLIPFIIGLLAAAIFAVMVIVYFGKYNDAKNNLDAHVATAVDGAKKQQQTDDQKQFAIQEKLPLRSYTTPANIGSIKVQFPKTWSDYIDLGSGDSSTPLDFYANPDYVPAQTTDTRYALRMQLVSQQYSQIVQQYNNQVTQGKAKASPITVSGVQGIRIDGEFKVNISGAIIILPLRSQTLMFWTESKNFLPDFNKNIVPNISFKS